MQEDGTSTLTHHWWRSHHEASLLLLATPAHTALPFLNTGQTVILTSAGSDDAETILTDFENSRDIAEDDSSAKEDSEGAESDFDS